MKKPFIIFILFAFFIILIPLILWFIKKPNSSTNITAPTPSLITPTTYNISPTLSLIIPSAKINSTPSYITINGVQTNDFIKTGTQINKEGDISITKISGSFNITYLAQFKEFLISITGSPFESQRQIAEKAFIQSLGISQIDACKLTINITTSIHINPNEAGKNYPLSFCQ